MVFSAVILSLAAVPSWERLPPIPDKSGVAGAFAGESGGSLLVAGGANFPDKMPWEGGAKVWHDVVYVLPNPNGVWMKAGILPRPLGYGVSIPDRDAVLCFGGSNKDRHYSDGFRMSWTGRSLTFAALPSLPMPVANACGTRLGDTIFVAGGLESPTAASTLHTFFALDLQARPLAWKKLEPWPGPPRMLAMAAALDGAFWLVGGVDLEAGPDGSPRRKYLRDAFRYVPGQGWSRLPDLPNPVAAAPSPCPTDAGGVFVLGGDDGSNVAYTPIAKHPGFSPTILRFDIGKKMWEKVGTWDTPRVTTTTVKWRERWIVPSGEVRPGVRSPDVWSLTLSEKRLR